MSMNETDNKRFWQRFAKLYAPFMRSSDKLYEEICTRIRPGLSKKQDVLELACGSGQLSHRLGTKVRNWEATDFSPNMIEEAEKRGHSASLHFSVQDATKLPYAPESFDVVVIANALHIMPHPDRALAEIHRVLKAGGKLYAPAFVHGKGSGFRLRVRILELAGFQVFSKWNEEEFADYVGAHGFAIEKTERLGKSIAPLCYLEAHKKSERR